MWKTALIVLAVVSTLAFAVSSAKIVTPAQAAVSPVIVDDDGGGAIHTYISFYKRLKASGVPVVLRGVCISACTLILILPKDQVCVEPTASLGFHLASDGEGADEPYTQALIRRHYPAAVQKWLADKKLTLGREEYLSAAEIVKMGLFPACKS